MNNMTDEEWRLVEWLTDMREDDALALARRMLLEGGTDPVRVLQLCRAAMDRVGSRFQEGEYSLPEVVLAGEMLETIGAIARPLIECVPGEKEGLRDQFKISGGCQVDATVRACARADAFRANAVEGWMGLRS